MKKHEWLKPVRNRLLKNITKSEIIVYRTYWDVLMYGHENTYADIMRKTLIAEGGIISVTLKQMYNYRSMDYNE